MMDDLYDNLDNYNEESTIAELREENKELKVKLEEYAAALEKLQKEFDILASEHKQLEVNYSSLLKTARSEIERKTQIITKLNIEKDAMVLNSIQNRNLPHNRRKNNQMHKQQESKFGKQACISREDSFWKPSYPNQLPNESNSSNIVPPENLKSTLNKNTPHTNIQTRLLDMVNNTIGNTNINSAKTNEVKENIRNSEAEKTRARISNRRKSMPVFSMDCARFSTDEDEVGSTESAKEFMSRRNLDSLPIGKPSLENKVSGHLESSRETRNRLSKYDSDIYNSRDKSEVSQRFRRNNIPDANKVSSERKRGSPERKRISPERRRVSPGRRRVSPDRRRDGPDRRRVSPDRRRISPERNKKRTQDHEEFYQRQELDKHRRLISPPKEKYHDYKLRSRETQRSHERSHPQDDRYKSRSQDKNTMKHKMLHDYEEPSKKMRLESHHQLEDRRKVLLEPGLVHLHDMSCQSPEYTNLEAQPSNQIREIKLNATTQLEDPRRSSTKYSLKTHDGKPELSTVESANIDVKVIDTSGWEMVRTMKMPDALLQRPKSMVVPDALHQKPSATIMSDALIQDPTSPDMADALPQKSTAIPHTLDQKPSSLDVACALIKKPVSPDMPHITRQKLMCTDISHAVHQKSTSSDKSLIQHPTSTKMPDAFVQKAVFNDMPNILIQNQMSTGDPSPDALTQITDADISDVSTQKPKSKELVKAMYMDIENPISNISMESGEIYDYDDVETQSSEANEKYVQNRHHVIEQQTRSQKLTNYKIPKKSSNKPQTAEIGKDMLLPEKYKDDKPNPKLRRKVSSKINDINKVTTETSKMHDKNPSQKKNMIPRRRSSDFQSEFNNYMTAKEIIEGDLELSDETSDNTDIQIMKRTLISDDKQDKINVPKLYEQSNIKFDKTGQKLAKHDLEEKNKDTIVKEKNPKAKKKSQKLKETQVSHEDATLSMDKPVKKNGDKSKEQSEIKDTPLSMDQLVKIKEKLTKELQNTTLSTGNHNDNKSKKPSDNKETVLTVDKSDKIKENKPKELLVIKDTAPSTYKLANQKEKTKEPPANKDITAVDNPVKKKENKTNESPENKNTRKPGKKKLNKPRGSEKTAPTMENKITNKDKEFKAKETKFNELFGDSSSLVSPEDLGLVPAVVPQENYVAMFEDAQDGIDIATITATSASTEKTNETVGIAQSKNFNSDIVNTQVMTVEPINTTQEYITKELVQAEPTPIHNMYQNLQAEILPKENDTVKTIVISTGVQPHFTLDATKTNPIVSDTSKDLHVMQCVKPTVLQGMVIHALATSTPHKIGQQNVQAVKDPMPNSRCATNESRDASVNKTTAIDNSVSNTDASLTNDADEPDMKIFVKRRRKVVKKNSQIGK